MISEILVMLLLRLLLLELVQTNLDIRLNIPMLSLYLRHHLILLVVIHIDPPIKGVSFLHLLLHHDSAIRPLQVKYLYIFLILSVLLLPFLLLLTISLLNLTIVPLLLISLLLLFNLLFEFQQALVLICTALCSRFARLGSLSSIIEILT